MTDSLSIDELLTRKKPVTEKVILVLDGDVVDEWNAASKALSAAQASKDKGAIEVAESELNSLSDALDAATLTMVFGAIGRKAYNALIDEHPPSEEQEAEAKANDQKFLFNLETFAPALIAASLVSPKYSEQDVTRLYESGKFNEEELSSLFIAAVSVNNRSKVVDLKKGFGPTTD